MRILCKRRDVVLGGGVLAHQVEQTDLTALLALAVARRLFEQSLVRRHQRRARIAEAVERARLDQTFHDALVDDAGLEAGQHVGHALVLAVFLALFYERLHRVRADVLDAVEPVAQLAVLDLEQHAALVDVGRQDLKAVVAQDRQILLHLFGVGDAVVDDRGEQLDLVISFVESGLIGQHRIGGGVRLVERVLGEARHLVEDLVGGIFVDDADLDRAGDARFGKPDESAVGRIFRRFGRRAVEEDLALRLHDLGFFLAHRAAQHVRRPERIACQQLSHLHDLFLIDETAVCHLENGSEQRMAVGDALGIFLGRDIFGDAVHRTGAIERHARYDVFERGRLKFFHELFHAGGFELEHRVGVAAADLSVDLGVVVAQLVEVDVHAVILFDVLPRLVYVGQRLEPEEVHFEHAHLLDLFLLELRGDVLAVALERDVVGDDLFAYDDACGML